MRFSHKDAKPQRSGPCGEAAFNLGSRDKGKRRTEARLRRGHAIFVALCLCANNPFFFS
jgi:hypothetical protein